MQDNGPQEVTKNNCERNFFELVLDDEHRYPLFIFFLVPANCCLQLTRDSLNEMLESCRTSGAAVPVSALHAARRGWGGITE